MSELKPEFIMGGDGIYAGLDKNKAKELDFPCMLISMPNHGDFAKMREVLKNWDSCKDGWISVGEHPKCSGRYTIDSSYGVRDSFFSEGFIVGDFRWQDCETGNDEGVENHDGIEFEVYNWMPLPKPPKA